MWLWTLIVVEVVSEHKYKRFIWHIIKLLNGPKCRRPVLSFNSRVAINVLTTNSARRTDVFSEFLFEITERLPFMFLPPMPSFVVKFCRKRVLYLGRFLTRMCLRALPDPSASLSVGAAIAPILSVNSHFFPHEHTCRTVSCCVADSLHSTTHHQC